MKKVAIIQSNYIPWKGYFHIIQSVDDFVFLDSVQYTPRDWRNRNRVKTRNGLKWLTVPVRAERSMTIREVRIDETDWQDKHYKTLYHAYHDCPHFDRYRDFLENLYRSCEWKYLHRLNRHLIQQICRFLGTTTRFHCDSDFNPPEDRNHRLLDIVKRLGGDVYVSGPAAKEYLDTNLFTRNGLKVEFFEYPEYPVYPQINGTFEHCVTILDLLFHMGDRSAEYIWGGAR